MMQYKSYLMDFKEAFNTRFGESSGGRTGASSGAENGKIKFNYKGLTYDVFKTELPKLLKELFKDKFDEMEKKAKNDKITSEYGFDIWIDEEGNLQSNGVAVRSSGKDNEYIPAPGKGLHISSVHTHQGDDGSPSGADVAYGLRENGFVTFIVHKDQISALQNSNGTSIIGLNPISFTLNKESVIKGWEKDGIASEQYYNNKTFMGSQFLINYFTYYNIKFDFYIQTSISKSLEKVWPK